MPRPRKVFYGYFVVVSGLIISITMWGSYASFGVFITPVIEEFGWSRAAVSGGFSAATIMAGFLSIFTGKLSDKHGPRIILTIAGFFLGSGYLLMSTLNSIWQIYLFYGIISIGMSAALVPVLSTVARWFIGMRGLMSGIVISGSGIGLAVILPMANLLIIDYGWRTSYLLLGIFCVSVIIFAAQFLRKDPSCIHALPYQKDGAPYRFQTFTIQELTFKEALKSYRLWFLSAIFFIVFFLYYLFLVNLVSFAISIGVGTFVAVTAMSIMGITGIAGRILMGVISDKAGIQKVMWLNGLIMTLSLIIVTVSNNPLGLMIFGVLFGFSIGGFSTMESIMVAHLFGMRSHGAIFGLVFCCDSMGGALGPIVAGLVLDIASSFNPVLITGLALALINLFMIFLVSKGQKSPGHALAALATKKDRH